MSQARTRRTSGNSRFDAACKRRGKVAELTGLERKAVDEAFAAMKKEGSVVSPIRCKWEPAFLVGRAGNVVKRFDPASAPMSFETEIAALI